MAPTRPFVMPASLVLALLAALLASAGAPGSSSASAAAAPRTLFLWRHADAEEAGAGSDDARALTDKGARQAARGAAWLRRRLEDLGADTGGSGVRVLVSPARRAQQTARALKAPLRLETSAAVGLAASARDLLDAAAWLALAAPPRNGSASAPANSSRWRRREWAGEAPPPARAAHVTIVVGHAPTLGRAAALALAGFEGEFMALKKGGVIWLEESDGGVVLRGMLSPSQLKADSSS